MSKKSEMLRQKNRLEIQQAMHKELSKAHTLGISRGAYAMCQIVLKKANNPELTLEERLTDIVRFCMKARNPDEKKSAETPATEETAQEAKADEV